MLSNILFVVLVSGVMGFGTLVPPGMTSEQPEPVYSEPETGLEDPCTPYPECVIEDPPLETLATD
ncbi:MAG: hypothetical protein OQJ89_09835 [Kangiellaceae bacterium]|nr:hypothetical protein [Kangiellaceae bacterium]MCW9017255.1 hypothetical protein [Kangiellaceae bacterium]